MEHDDRHAVGGAAPVDAVQAHAYAFEGDIPGLGRVRRAHLPVLRNYDSRVTVLDALAPDVLLLNGRLLTMDAHGSRAEGLAVRNGRIVAVGATADLRELAGPRTQVIDLAGRTAIPGLVDPHLHLASHAPLRQLVDVRYWFTQIRSNVDVLSALHARAQTTPPG